MLTIRAKNILWTTAIVYCLVLVAWFLAWRTFGDANWFLIALNRYALFGFVPTPLLLGFWFVDRRRVLLALVPGTIFLAVYGLPFVPGWNRGQPGLALRVMSFNILYSNTDYVAIADLVTEIHPDLIGLQEVSPGAYRYLQQALADEYPWSYLGPEHPYGSTAIFSRASVVEFKDLDLRADRAAVVAEVQVDGQPIRFISAHLLAYGLVWHPIEKWPTLAELRTAEQRQQASLLAQIVEATETPVILVCDCNAQVTSDTYRTLTNVLLDSAQPRTGSASTLGRELIYPEGRLDRIDYQFHQGPLISVGAYVIDTAAGSDHQPIVVDYRWLR